MSITALVIDTSYIVELYKVPGMFDLNFAEHVKKRFGQAIADKHRLYVPSAVIFEVANHIAHIRDTGARKQQADQLADTVRSSVKDATPWIITPAPEDTLYNLSELLRLCDKYAQEFAFHKIGLSDTALIEEARRLAKKYNQPGDRVHLWTKDKVVKRYEPHPEPNPLL